MDYEFTNNLGVFIEKIDVTYFSSIQDIDHSIVNYRKETEFGTVSKFYFYFIESERFF